MATFTVSDWKAAFKTQLEARGGLAGVEVYDHEVAVPDRAREFIIIGDWEQDDTHFAMGGRFEETVDITGRVVARKPDTAKAARDRALAILKEVKDQLVADAGTNNTAKDAHFRRARGEERIWADSGRECEIEFTVNVRATNE
jgi:hypothetical protein